MARSRRCEIKYSGGMVVVHYPDIETRGIYITGVDCGPLNVRQARSLHRALGIAIEKYEHNNRCLHKQTIWSDDSEVKVTCGLQRRHIGLHIGSTAGSAVDTSKAIYRWHHTGLDCCKSPKPIDVEGRGVVCKNCGKKVTGD